MQGLISTQEEVVLQKKYVAQRKSAKNTKLPWFPNHRKRLLVAIKIPAYKWQYSVDNTDPNRCLNRKFSNQSYETDQNVVELWIRFLKLTYLYRTVDFDRQTFDFMLSERRQFADLQSLKVILTFT